MRSPLFISAALLLAACTGTGSLPAESLPTVEVPFELIANQIAFEVTVNGAGPFSFRLDSGIHPSSVSNQVARLAKLEPGPVAGNVAGFGSAKIPYRKVTVPRIAVGGLELENLAAVTVDLPIPKERLDVDGVLGHSFLSRVVTQIDYPQRKLRFRPRLGPEPEAGTRRHVVPLRSTGVGPLLDLVEIDGVPIRVSLDTGASAGLILSERAIRSVGLEKERAAAEIKTAYGARGAFEARVGTLAGAHIGPFEVEDMAVGFAPPGLGESLLGNDVLKHFCVTLDYDSRTLTIERGLVPEG